MNQEQSSGTDDSENDDDQQGVCNITVFRKRDKLDNDEDVDIDTFKKMKNMLTCPICLELFKDPVYVKGCSHRFCKECIEKAIRQSKKKTCPTCRKTIGTKRLLRIDDNISTIIQIIFGNVMKYLIKQDEEELKELCKKYGKNAFDSVAKVKRPRVKREEKEEEEENVNNNVTNIATTLIKSRKRQKINQEIEALVKEEDIKFNAQAKIEEELKIKQEKDAEEEKQSENQLPFDNIGNTENLEYLQVLFEKNPEMLQSIDTFITCSLKVLPSDQLIKQIEKNVFRTNAKATLDALSKFVSKKLNFKVAKYSQRIKFWILQDNKFIDLDKSESLRNLNEKYWKYYKDYEVYDIYDMFQSILNNPSNLPAGDQRELYYSLDLSDMLK